MGLTLCFSGSETDWTAGDISPGVVAGSTHAILSIKNTSNVPVKFYFRQTGTSDEENRDITPGESKQITVALTSARTVEYKIEGGGSISCYVVTAFGSGLYLTTVTVADIRTTLLDSGYSTSDITDAAIQGYIDIINAEVTDAATRHANIAGFTLNASIKTNAIKYGALAETLNLLRTKGAATGLTQDRIIISGETLDNYRSEFKEMLEGIWSGIKYGA